MNTTVETGKSRRLSRFFNKTSHRSVLVPIDDSLISGPTNGLEYVIEKTQKIVAAQPDAIMGFPGLMKKGCDVLKGIPLILNLTASTTQSSHTRKVLVGSLEQAVQLGVEAVAVHVNISSQFEPEMLKILGKISRECDSFGMPLLAIMYPRSESNNGDNNYLNLKNTDPQKFALLVAHACRVGIDMGADMIKTQYTGTPDSFEFVVRACEPLPIVVAGGPALPLQEMLQMAYDIIQAGARGISFGRNVFSRTDPLPFIKALKAIVHENANPQDLLFLWE